MFLHLLCSRSVSTQTVTFSSLINAYSKAGDMAGADKAFTLMRAQGLQPTEAAYGALIDGYVVIVVVVVCNLT